MLPFFIGLTTAFTFASLAAVVYGVDALISAPWAILVLWGLLAGPGLMLVAAREEGPCSR